MQAVMDLVLPVGGPELQSIMELHDWQPERLTVAAPNILPLRQWYREGGCSNCMAHV